MSETKNVKHQSVIRISETRSILAKALSEYKPKGLTEMEAVQAFLGEAQFWSNEAWKSDCDVLTEEVSK